MVTALLLAMCTPLTAQRVSGRFMSSVYAWEKFDTVDVPRSILRGAQTAMIDIGHGDVSLSASMDGFATLDSSFSESALLNVYSLHLRARNVLGGEFSLGRQAYFIGAGFGTMDGVLARFPVAEVYRVTVYGGQPVSTDLSLGKSLKEQFLFGGQVLVTSLPSTRVGLSYVNRQRKPESYMGFREVNLQPVEVLIDPAVLKEQYVNADVAYAGSGFNAYGRYDFDLNRSETYRAQINTDVHVTDHIRLDGDFIHRAPRIPFNSFFAVFPIHNTSELDFGVDYQVMKGLRMNARGGLVLYEDETSSRFSFGAWSDFGGLMYRMNTGYSGELNTVTLSGSYPFLDRMIIPNISFSFSSYRLSEKEDTESMFAATLGAVFRPMQAVSVDAQMQWLHNRIYDRDVRFFGRVSYWFSEQLNILR